MQLRSSVTELKGGWFRSKFWLSALNTSCQYFRNTKDKKSWTMQEIIQVTVCFCVSAGKAKILLQIIKFYGGGVAQIHQQVKK